LRDLNAASARAELLLRPLLSAQLALEIFRHQLTFASHLGAAAEILAHFFPKDAGWLRDWAKTAARSPLYGGIHTAIENESGLRLGQQVAGATLQRLGRVTFTYE
jgi:hypothetical protein